MAAFPSYSTVIAQDKCDGPVNIVLSLEGVSQDPHWLLWSVHNSTKSTDKRCHLSLPAPSILTAAPMFLEQPQAGWRGQTPLVAAHWPQYGQYHFSNRLTAEDWISGLSFQDEAQIHIPDTYAIHSTQQERWLYMPIVWIFLFSWSPSCVLDDSGEW